MKRNLVAAAAAASLALAGLTGCAANEAHPAPRQIVAYTRSAPAGPVMTIKKAKETYLKLSTASNAARDAWLHLPMPSTANLAKHKKLAGRAADATTAFAKGLESRRWPSKIQPLVDALDGHLQRRAVAYRRAAKAGTVAEYLAAAVQVPVTSTLASDMRKALGLPAAPEVKGVSPR